MSFKVICIDASHTEKSPVAPFILKENEIYEVVNTKYAIKPEWLWYELSVQRGVGYAAERFVPVSDIDETDFVREEIKIKEPA